MQEFGIEMTQHAARFKLIFYGYNHT